MISNRVVLTAVALFFGLFSTVMIWVSNRENHTISVEVFGRRLVVNTYLSSLEFHTVRINTSASSKFDLSFHRTELPRAYPMYFLGNLDYEANGSLRQLSIPLVWFAIGFLVIAGVIFFRRNKRRKV